VAESALDGYLLKPHKATQLEQRLLLARRRKQLLQEIFNTIDAQDFARGVQLCLERFRSKGPFWLYSARIGAELLLRLQRYDEAQELYQSVVGTNDLPWAKLGVARCQLEAGQSAQACSTLQTLIDEDPEFADAYDVLGRALFEQGLFDRALDTYQTASALTPSSISRLQSAAMMTFYQGEPRDAERLLERTTRLGLESKLFDAQTLVLLALTRLDLQDRRGLQRCQDDFTRLSHRCVDNARIQRLAHFAYIIARLQQQETEDVLAGVAVVARTLKDADFDLESANNLVAILTRMRTRDIYFLPAEQMIQTIALRFCSSRPVTEMLASCALAHAPYAEWIRAAQGTVLAQAETALAQVLAGDVQQGITGLLDHAHETLNVRLIDNAYQLLLKHQEILNHPDELLARALALRLQAGAGNRKLTLGRQLRPTGGLVLRSGPR
jgi:tetratricopeptide (TPR) repeat protein